MDRLHDLEKDIFNFDRNVVNDVTDITTRVNNYENESYKEIFSSNKGLESVEFGNDDFISKIPVSHEVKLTTTAAGQNETPKTIHNQHLQNSNTTLYEGLLLTDVLSKDSPAGKMMETSSDLDSRINEIRINKSKEKNRYFANLHYPTDDEKMSVEMKMENLFNNSTTGNCAAIRVVENIAKKTAYDPINRNNTNTGLRDDKPNMYSFSSQLLDELKDEFSLSSVINEQDESVENTELPHSESSVVSKNVDDHYFEDNFTDFLSEGYKDDNHSSKKSKSRSPMKNFDKRDVICDNSVEKKIQITSSAITTTTTTTTTITATTNTTDTANTTTNSLDKNDFYNGSLFDSSSDIFQSFNHPDDLPSDYFAKDTNTDEFVSNSSGNVTDYNNVAGTDARPDIKSETTRSPKYQCSRNDMKSNAECNLEGTTDCSVINKTDDLDAIQALNNEESTDDRFSNLNYDRINCTINNVIECHERISVENETNPSAVLSTITDIRTSDEGENGVGDEIIILDNNNDEHVVSNNAKVQTVAASSNVNITSSSGKENLSKNSARSNRNNNAQPDIHRGGNYELDEVKSEPYSELDDEEMRSLEWPADFIENVKMTMAGVEDDLNFDNEAIGGNETNDCNYDQNEADDDNDDDDADDDDDDDDEADDDEDSRLSPRSMMPWLCLYCPTYCDNKDQYMEHLKLHDRTTATASNLSSSFATTEAAADKMSSSSTSSSSSSSSSAFTNKVLRCEVCGKVLPTINSLQEHMLVHTNLEPHVCLKCNKSFRHADRFRAHVESHKTRQLCKCNICGIVVCGNEQYNRHLKDRHPAMESDDFSERQQQQQQYNLDDDSEDDYRRSDDGSLNNFDPSTATAGGKSSNNYYWNGARSSTYLMENAVARNRKNHINSSSSNLIGGRYNKRPVKRHLCLSINDDDSDVGRDDGKDEDYVYDESEEQFDDIEEEFQKYGKRRKRTRYDSDEDYRLPSEEGRQRLLKAKRTAEDNEQQQQQQQLAADDDLNRAKKRPGRPRGSKNKADIRNNSSNNTNTNNNNKNAIVGGSSIDNDLNNLSFDYYPNNNIVVDKHSSGEHGSNSNNNKRVAAAAADDSYADRYLKKMMKRKQKLKRFISKLKNKNVGELYEIKDRIESKKYTYEGSYGEENDAIVDKLCAIIDRRIDRYNRREARIAAYRAKVGNDVDDDDENFNTKFEEEEDDDEDDYDLDEFDNVELLAGIGGIPTTNETAEAAAESDDYERPAIKVYKYHKERVVYLPKVDIENVVCDNVGGGGANKNNNNNNSRKRKYIYGDENGTIGYCGINNSNDQTHDYEGYYRNDELGEDHEKIVADELSKFIGHNGQGLTLCKKDDLVAEELNKIRNQMNLNNNSNSNSNNNINNSNINNNHISRGVAQSVRIRAADRVNNNNNYYDRPEATKFVVYGDEQLVKTELEAILGRSSVIDGNNYSCIIDRSENDIISSELRKAVNLSKAVVVGCEGDRNFTSSNQNLTEILNGRRSVLEYRGTETDKIVARELKRLSYTWNSISEKNLKNLCRDSCTIKNNVILIKTRVSNNNNNNNNRTKYQNNRNKLSSVNDDDNTAGLFYNKNNNDDSNPAEVYNVNAVHEDTEPGYIMKICDIWNEAIKLRHHNDETKNANGKNIVSDFQEIAQKRLNVIVDKLNRGINIKEPVLMGPLFWKNTLSECGIENLDDLRRKNSSDVLLKSNNNVSGDRTTLLMDGVVNDNYQSSTTSSGMSVLFIQQSDDEIQHHGDINNSSTLAAGSAVYMIQEEDNIVNGRKPGGLTFIDNINLNVSSSVADFRHLTTDNLLVVDSSGANVNESHTTGQDGGSIQIEDGGNSQQIMLLNVPSNVGGGESTTTTLYASANTLVAALDTSSADHHSVAADLGLHTAANGGFLINISSSDGGGLNYQYLTGGRSTDDGSSIINNDNNQRGGDDGEEDISSVKDICNNIDKELSDFLNINYNTSNNNNNNTSNKENDDADSSVFSNPDGVNEFNTTSAKSQSDNVENNQADNIFAIDNDDGDNNTNNNNFADASDNGNDNNIENDEKSNVYDVVDTSRRMENDDTSRRMEDDDTSRRTEDDDTSRRMVDDDTSRRLEDDDTSRQLEDDDTSRRMEGDDGNLEDVTNENNSSTMDENDRNELVGDENQTLEEEQQQQLVEATQQFATDSTDPIMYEVVVGDTGIIVTLGSDRVKDVESIIESVNQALAEANISLDDYEGNLDFTINEIHNNLANQETPPIDDGVNDQQMDSFAEEGGGSAEQQTEVTEAAAVDDDGVNDRQMDSFAEEEGGGSAEQQTEFTEAAAAAVDDDGVNDQQMDSFAEEEGGGSAEQQTEFTEAAAAAVDDDGVNDQQMDSFAEEEGGGSAEQQTEFTEAAAAVDDAGVNDQQMDSFAEEGGGSAEPEQQTEFTEALATAVDDAGVNDQQMDSFAEEEGGGSAEQQTEFTEAAAAVDDDGVNDQQMDSFAEEGGGSAEPEQQTEFTEAAAAVDDAGINDQQMDSFAEEEGGGSAEQQTEFTKAAAAVDDAGINDQQMDSFSEEGGGSAEPEQQTEFTEAAAADENTMVIETNSSTTVVADENTMEIETNSSTTVVADENSDCPPASTTATTDVNSSSTETENLQIDKIDNDDSNMADEGLNTDYV